jgi:hypothetical protein
MLTVTKATARPVNAIFGIMVLLVLYGDRFADHDLSNGETGPEATQSFDLKTLVFGLPAEGPTK